MGVTVVGVSVLGVACSSISGGPPAAGGERSAPISSAATSDGLITAQSAECADLGRRVLAYLRSGDNGGDPNLDVEYSGSVGVPLPQARSIADSAINECDDTARSSSDGAGAGAGTGAPATPALDGAAVAQGVRKVVSENYGEAVSDVRCPDRIPADVGVSVTCWMTVGGVQKSALVTVTSSSGTYEVGRPS